MLPWEARARRVYLLFKMCKKANKVVFAAGLGLGMMVHYCSVGYKTVNVINGKEKGSVLDDINLIPKDICLNLEKNEVFLDSTSGDFFYFHPDSAFFMTGLLHRLMWSS